LKQHVDRTGENRFPKKILKCKPIGVRDVGRKEVDGRASFELLN
jgi:hypothetical protein